jgi:hypothetical protein
MNAELKNILLSSAMTLNYEPEEEPPKKRIRRQYQTISSWRV